MSCKSNKHVIFLSLIFNAYMVVINFKVTNFSRLKDFKIRSKISNNIFLILTEFSFNTQNCFIKALSRNLISKISKKSQAKM